MRNLNSARAFGLCFAIVFTLSCGASGDKDAIRQQIAKYTAALDAADVDLAYETFGARGAALPVIAVNGGPGLSHAYMLVGDFWPKIMATHYSYGAILWVFAALFWAAYTVPKVFITEAE